MTTINYPAFPADIQATIDKYPALQHLRDNKRAMYDAILHKIVGEGNASMISNMEDWPAAIQSTFASIDTLIQQLGYDVYNFGTSDDPVVLSDIMLNMLQRHEQAILSKLNLNNVVYTKEMFQNNYDIIYAPAGTASGDVRSCFRYCYLLQAIGDIDFSGATNMSYMFQYCYLLKFPLDYTLNIPYCTTITATNFGRGKMPNSKLTIIAPVLTNIRESLVSRYDEVHFINCNSITSLGGQSIGACSKIYGLNMSKVIDSGGAFLNSVIQELHLVEGSYIQYRQSLRGGNNNTSANSRGAGTCLNMSGVSAQVKCELIEHLYDWTRNDQQLEDLTLIVQEYPYTRILDASDARKNEIATYAKNNELLGCFTTDTVQEAIDKITTNYIIARDWSW